MQRNGLFRDTLNTDKAVAAYVELANSHNITPAHLALAWCDQVTGITSSIIGATSMSQLQENIAAFERPLSQALLSDIANVFKQHPAPF